MINNCCSKSRVTGGNNAGGLVGSNLDTSIISSCYAISTVSGDQYIGGLAGQMSYASTIINSYAQGSITGTTYTGGFAGFSHKSTISNCYAAAPVQGTINTGGLVAGQEGSAITMCYYDGSLFMGNNGIGIALTTAQMKQQLSYPGWDFASSWAIAANLNNGYPHLKNQLFELRTNTIRVKGPSTGVISAMKQPIDVSFFTVTGKLIAKVNHVDQVHDPLHTSPQILRRTATKIAPGKYILVLRYSDGSVNCVEKLITAAIP